MNSKKRYGLLAKIAGLSVIAIAAIVVCCTVIGSAPVAKAEEFADIKGTKRYVIDNPYATVDWDNWRAYKSMTHAHSNISDGDSDFAEMIGYYYSAGYDSLSMTDHGTVNYGWAVNKSRHTIFGYQAILHGSAEGLSNARNAEITTGVGRDGRGMIDIPLGIELNGASTNKVHVCGWFADAGDGDMEMNASGVSGMITAIKKNHKAGGLSHVNHVGEWSDQNYNATFINDFTNAFKTYPSCVGMELVNTSDGRTSQDRYLYDLSLAVLAPLGRHMWGFCEDDAHELSDVDRNAQYMWLPSNTVANIRTCITNGAFFASSKNSKGVNELNGVTGTGDYPMVSRVTIEEQTSQIHFNVTKANTARIVANGTLLETIACSEAGDTVIFDLNKYEASIGSYVRVYFTGPGGITYVQPFYLTSVPYKESAVTFNVNAVDSVICVYNAAGSLLPASSVTRISASYIFNEVGTYNYTVSKAGFETYSSSFTLTINDISEGNDYSYDIDLKQLPTLVFNTGITCTPDELTKTIDGFVPGENVFDQIAHSSNENGQIEIEPTGNGYGTGTKINLKTTSGEVLDSYTVIIYGDVDGDGKVTACDANVISARIYNMPMTQAATAACDVNNDGYFNQTDIDMLVDYGVTLGNALDIVQSR